MSVHQQKRIHRVWKVEREKKKRKSTDSHIELLHTFCVIANNSVKVYTVYRRRVSKFTSFSGDFTSHNGKKRQKNNKKMIVPDGRKILIA